MRPMSSGLAAASRNACGSSNSAEVCDRLRPSGTVTFWSSGKLSGSKATTGRSYSACNNCSGDSPRLSWYSPWRMVPPRSSSFVAMPIASRAADSVSPVRPIVFSLAGFINAVFARKFEELQAEFKDVSATVAVMPFVNVTGNKNDQWMAQGASEALMTDLPKLDFTLVEPPEATPDEESESFIERLEEERRRDGEGDAAAASLETPLLDDSGVVEGLEVPIAALARRESAETLTSLTLTFDEYAGTES